VELPVALGGQRETSPAVASLAARERADSEGVGAPSRLLATAASAPRRLWLRTTDDVVLKAVWSVPLATPRATVVLSHGFSATSEHPEVAALAEMLVGNGYAALRYDARGHGRSSGHSGVGSAEHLDVAAALDEAAGQGLPVVAVGVSMGAVAVARCLADQLAPGQVVGAVLVSAPSRWRMRPSLVGIATAALTRTPPGRAVAARWLRVRVQPGWQTGETLESCLGRVRLPVAIVHGSKDRLLAPLHGSRLRASARGPCRLEVVTGMGHGVEPACRHAVMDAVEWVLEHAPDTSRS
jgi:alpha-beta hydrolase superfamily lysophospholipase